MSAKPAQSRKRKAGADLRALAHEVGVTATGRNYDFNAADFKALLDTVLPSCSTPEQKKRAQDAKELYEQRGAGVEVLPQVPKLPAIVPSGGAASVGAEPADLDDETAAAAGVDDPFVVESPTQFRLRGTSCLFTYNSPEFCGVDPNALWQEFLTFLQGLSFLLRWTATLEESLRSAAQRRFHLHVFMEFKKAVDWTSLAKVAFRGGRPDARPTAARGDKQREVINHGAQGVGSSLVYFGFEA